MKTNKLSTWAVWASALLALPVSGCAPADDAGDVSFVIEATQAVLGRKPRGTAEVQSLLGVLQGHGREAVIDVLMEEPDFVEYWIPVVSDAMQAQQRYRFTQNAACFNDPIYMVDGTGNPCAANTGVCAGHATQLADMIRDHTAANRGFDPDGDGTPNEFNMNDLLRAALLADDLQVAYLPWLFALAAKHGNSGPEANRDNFLMSAFNVQTSCIACHSSTYSKTELYPSSQYGGTHDDNQWDRTSPLGWNLEQTAFGVHTSLDVTNDPSCGSFTTNAYQDNCSFSTCHGADGTAFPSVGGGKVSPKRLIERVRVLSDDEIVAQIVNGGGHMAARDLDGDSVTGMGDAQDKSCAESIAAFLREQLGGYQDIAVFLDPAQFDPAGTNTSDCPGAPAPESTGPWGLSASACGFVWTGQRVCDPSGQGYALAGGYQYHTDVSDLTGALKDGIVTLESEPGATVTATADPNLPSTSTPQASLAALLVQNIADDLLFELSARRTTVAHGLSRNTTQAMALQYMMSTLLVDDGTHVRISLKTGLKEAILSTFFNRTTPAYDFEMYFNPWAAHDPTSSVPADPTAGDDRNGLGDLVHRRSANQLLWSVHRDLGWGTPRVMPNNATFPGKDFEQDIGRYQSANVPVNPVWDLNSLAILESQVGVCYSADTPQDWIWQLANGVYNGTVQACTPTCAAPTIRQLLLGTKDRLIQDPQFDPVARGGVYEVNVTRDLVTSELGAPPAGCTGDILDCQATLWTKPTISVLLRKYCSGVIMSPAYLMQSLPTVTNANALPAVTVCLPGEICQKPDLDNHYATALCTLHYTCP